MTAHPGTDADLEPVARSRLGGHSRTHLIASFNPYGVGNARSAMVAPEDEGPAHSGGAPQVNPSGSVNDPASPLIRIRCDPVPSGATPADLASARRL